MKREALFEHDDPVVVQGRREVDTIVGACAFLALAVFIGGGLEVALGSQPDWKTAWIALGGALFFGWAFANAAWRLRDREPALIADRTGLRLHPSLAPRPLPWSEIRSIAIKSPGGARGPNVVRIRLKRPVRSLAYPLGSTLRLTLPYLGLTHREAADLLRQLRRLRGLKVVGPREGVRASPDPDAAD